MPNDRVNAALTVIEAIAGADDRRVVENKLCTKDLTQIDGYLSIGGFRGPFKSEPETFRRSLVRAVMLVKLARNDVLPAAVAQKMTTLMNKTTAAIQRELLRLFPYKAYRGSFEKRKDWAPTKFTDPSKHTNDRYMYLVHCLMQDTSKVAEYSLGNTTEIENFNKLREKYLPYAQVVKKNPIKPPILMVDFMEQYLANPNIIRQNIISGSLISNAKHPTYYPVGFIMRVPPECIYITWPEDASIANRTTDILGEFQKNPNYMTILTPEEVLTKTKQVGGSSGYNEIVIVGTAPEGKQVDVIGIFVKTDLRGNLYVRGSSDTAAWLTPRSAGLISECAKKFTLPIVPIADATSVVLSNPTPWPFDITQTVISDARVRRDRSGTM